MKKEKNKFSLHTEKIYKPSEVLEVLHLAIRESYLIGNNKGIYYYNIPCSFDIETSSFYIDENEKALENVNKALEFNSLNSRIISNKELILRKEK